MNITISLEDATWERIKFLFGKNPDITMITVLSSLFLGLTSPLYVVSKPVRPQSEKSEEVTEPPPPDDDLRYLINVEEGGTSEDLLNDRYIQRSINPAQSEKSEEVTEQPEQDNRNTETLASFVEYCQKNPEQSFWQALHKWSGYLYICGRVAHW